MLGLHLVEPAAVFVDDRGRNAGEELLVLKALGGLVDLLGEHVHASAEQLDAIGLCGFLGHFGQHVVCHEDRRLERYPQRDCVGRAGIDLDDLLAPADVYRGDERMIAKIVYHDLLQPPAHRIDHVGEQVVRHGARRLLVVQPPVDGDGFVRADLDRKAATAAFLLQDDDLLVAELGDQHSR